jgi:uncharacterized protein (DUF4415 family)
MKTSRKKIKYGKVDIPDEEFQPRNVKERITIMIDQDILDAFKAKAAETGDKYQSLINRTLREALTRPSLEDRVERIEKRLKKMAR